MKKQINEKTNDQSNKEQKQDYTYIYINTYI